MSTTTSCAQCGAQLRPDQGWCSLCFAQVESAFDPLTAPLNELLELSGEGATPEAPVEPAAPELPAAPVAEVASVTPDGVPEADEAVTDVDVMFSMLAAEHRMSDPAVSLAERLGDRSTRITVMVGGTILIAGVGFLLLTILGAIL